MEKEVANPEERPWSDLHTDHLLEIVQRLDVKDYIRFSITCKSWRSVPEPPHPGDRRMRMRLMQIKNRDGACDFIDPTSNKMHHAEFPELAGVKVWSAKGDWLLASALHLHQHRFFFFHLASLEQRVLPVIQLLSLFLSNLETITPVAFSSPPTSTRCTVVMFCDNDDSTSTGILTWRLGDDRWTLQGVYDPFPVQCSCVAPCGRLFYCAGRHGELAELDPESGTFRRRKMPRTIKHLSESVAAPLMHMVGFRGQIYLVWIGGDRKQPVRIFKVDPVDLDAEEIQTLEDRVIYVGLTTASMAAAPRAEMADRVYFPLAVERSRPRLHLHYYSMWDRRYIPDAGFRMAAKLRSLLDGRRAGYVKERLWIHDGDDGDRLHQDGS